jgi:hypothetical protein
MASASAGASDGAKSRSRESCYGQKQGLMLVLRVGSTEYGGNRIRIQEIGSVQGVGLWVGARSWNRSKSKSAGARCT